MSSCGLANGAEAGPAAPVPRLSPRLRAKDGWARGPDARREQDKSWSTRRGRGPEPWAQGGGRPQEQVWSSGGRGAPFSPDQTWAGGGAEGPEQDWEGDGDQSQAWSEGGDPAGGQGSSGSEQAWGSGPHQDQDQDRGWSESSSGREHIWRPGRPDATPTKTC